MASYEDDQGPYRGYQPRNFDTGNLPPPVRGAAPLTSTFDQPPLRGVAPPHSTSAFDKPPVRGVAQGGRASAPPLTTEYDEPPLRGVAPLRTTAPVTPPLTSRFDEPPVRGVAPGEAPIRFQKDDFDSAVNVERGHGSGQTPMVDHTSSGGKGYGTFWMAVADVVLRSLTSLCLVIALILFARFISDLNKYVTGVSLASPKYALAVSIIGIIYSLFQLTSAIFYLAMGHTMLPTKVSHLISYIGDQVFMVLFVSAGSAAASYSTTLDTALDCSGGSECARGAAGAAMDLLAFGFIAANSVLSTFCYYMTKT